MTVSSRKLARWTGLLVGTALAASLVLAGRMPASGAPAPAKLSVASKPTTELGVSPAGRELLGTRRLAPGAPAALGSLTLSNFTESRLDADVRLSGPATELDPLVRLELEASGKTIYRGTLEKLRSWQSGPSLKAGRNRRVRIRAWLPRSVPESFGGRSSRMTLEWKAGA